MSKNSGSKVERSSEAPLSISTKDLAILKLLSVTEISETSVLALSQLLNMTQFELGDSLLNYRLSDASDTSVQNKQIESLYVVCQGRVRILCNDPIRQRQVSALVLEEGETFGGDSQFCNAPLSYEAIGASGGQVAHLSLSQLEPWFERFPPLREVIKQQAIQRERLVFLRAYLARSVDGVATELLTSYQIQQWLPYLEEIQVSAGTALSEVDACQSGYFWLRQGEVEDVNSSSEPMGVGASWSRLQDTSTDWRAKTDLLIYKVSIEHWKTAIAPVLAAATNGSESTRTTSASPPTSRSLQPKAAETSPKADRSKPRLVPPVGAKPSSEPVRSPKQDRSSRSEGTIVPFPKPTKRRRWQPRLLYGYPFIQQQSSSDCGVACLSMIGQFWGKRFGINLLRDLAKVGRSGASLKNLAVAAESVGFQARPVRASLSRLEEQGNPWIAHWQGDHYVVVYRIKGDRVLVADPACGKRNLTRQEFLNSWTGYALLLDPTSQLRNAKTEKPDLGRFWGVLWSYRSVLWQIIFLSLLVQVFGLITPLFTQVILDRVVTQKSLATLHVFSIGLILFGIWRVGLVAVRQYLLDYFSNRIDLTLISAFISHTLALPLKFFEARQVGDIITRVQENRKIQMFLMRQAISTWLDASMAIVYLGLMFYYNWRLTLLVLALIPPIALLTLGATPFLRQISREVFNATAEQNSLMVEMLTGVATVKSVAAEREVRWRWEDSLTTTLNVQFKGQKFANNLQVVGGTINSLGSTALLWYGATLVIQGELTIGQFVAFNMLVGNVLSPVLSLVGLWDEFQEVLISVERLNDVFATEPEETPGQPMFVLPSIQGEMQFSNVTFSYDTAEEHNTLQNISFTVQAGQTIAIVGRSGSGKSTLVKLLQGLYHPTSGRILLDGHDIKHVSPQSLRSQMGIVPQECFLFSGTILENIQLYRPEFTLNEVVDVAKLAEAHTFIQDLPLGYNTKVGERGANLSGGQRQRIAIARALLGSPALLILDEATSSLDTESERRFQQNLARFSRGRTIFIIAHRLSTVRNADRILVLDRGVLVEQGTHDELIALQGLYYHLAQQQLDL
ncbi:MAG: peptidase domain-containing ABC transporter [Myxacorys californica WJT36-NPBG1]|nr:peptidase domain-containing ABC transporter [Myxacorys californica WJT36-NPBG1]